MTWYTCTTCGQTVDSAEPHHCAYVTVGSGNAVSLVSSMPAGPAPVDDVHDTQILQLIPATDWVAIFEPPSEDRPVVCLALTECRTHRNRAIVPVVSDTDSGELIDATQLEDYRGIVHVDEYVDDIDDPDDDAPDDH